jgi:hypothetical protein
MLMKVRRVLAALSFALFATVVPLFSLFPASSVYAAPARGSGGSNESYVFTFNQGQQSALDSCLPTNCSSSQLQNLYLFVQGGVVGSLLQLKYDQYESIGSGSNEPNFDGNYSCRGYQVTLLVDIHNLQNLEQSDYQSYVYLTNIRPPSGPDISNGGSSYLTQSQIDKLPIQCQPANLENGSNDVPTSIPNFTKLNSTQQAQWGATVAGVTTPPATPAPPGPAPAPPPGFDDACNAAQSSGALGWIMCSIIEVADKGINTIITNVLEPLLTVTPLSTSDPAYSVWQSMQTLANVFFVLIFLVIIFANTVRLNVETYAIKKILPKLVAAVVLVQFSYVISSVIVDIGNILGEGITGLVNVGVLHGIAGTPTGTLSFMQGALGFAAVGLLIIAVPGLLTLAVVALIGAAGVLITLVVRQLVIIMLVVLSPLAFAAWVLPNTERFFKMWLTNFIKVSLMFAMIMMLFALASIGTYTQVHAPAYDNTSGLQGIIASLFPIIAFFMVPMTFKWAGGAMGFASGFIADRTGKAKGAAGSKIDNSRPMQAIKARRAYNRQQRLLGAVTGEEGGLAGRLPKGLGRDKAVAARTALAKRWATGAPLRPNKGYGARQIADLEHQQLAEFEQLHKGKPVEELKRLMADPKTSKLETKAIAGVISRAGALDQPEVTALLLKKFGVTSQKGKDGKYKGDTKGAQAAFDYARDLNYGTLKKDNFAMLNFNVDKVDGDMIETYAEDVKDAAGKVIHEKGSLKITASADMVKAVEQASGAQIANQTTKGFDLLDTATDTSGRTLKELISETAKDSIKSAPSLRAEVSGNPVASRIVGIPIKGASGDDLDDVLGEPTRAAAPAPAPAAPAPAPAPLPTPQAGETITPGGVILPPGVDLSGPAPAASPTPPTTGGGGNPEDLGAVYGGPRPQPESPDES